MQLIRRFFSVSCLLPHEKRLGDIPSSREAYSSVLRMAWPAIVESMLVMLTSLLDTVMVGACGTTSIAAVGISSAIRNLVIMSYIALNGAISAIVARRIGERSHGGANNTLMHGMVLCAIISFIIVIPSFFFGRELIELCGAMPEHFPEATNYFYIWLAGVPVWAMSSVINAALRGAGNMRATMVSTLTAQVVNFILNYVLITGRFGFPALGVTGAAIATTASFIAQAVISFISILGRDNLFLPDFKKFRFNSSILAAIGKISSAALVQNLILCISQIFFSRIVNSLGRADAFATWQIIITLYNVLVAVATGLMAAVSTLTGQNLGKKRPDLALLDMKISFRFSAFTAIIFSFAFYFFGENLAFMYVPDRVAGAATIADIVRTLKVVAVFTILHTSIYVYSGVLSGAGDARFCGVVSVICVGLVRTVAAYLFCAIPGLGIVGAWFAVCIDELIRTGLFLGRIKRGKWAHIKL